MYYLSIGKLKQGIDHAQFNKVIAEHRECVKKQPTAGILVQAHDSLVLADMITFETQSFMQVAAFT